MPMRWVPPEEAFTVSIPKQTVSDFYEEEVTVYHVYKHQDFEQVLTYWYTLDQTEDPRMEFDIREVAYASPEGTLSRTHKEILQQALDDAVVTITLGDPPTLNLPPDESAKED